MPFVVDETQLGYMVDVFDFDLSRSLVAMEHERPIGRANLGVRGQKTWLGGVGVVPGRRRPRGGTHPHQARFAGGREMVLEVIRENAPAIALYEKLGFARTRELEVLSLSAAGGSSDARDTRLDDALDVIAAIRGEPEPWQRADETIDNLVRRGSTPRVMSVGGASACSELQATSPACESSQPHYARAAPCRR